jgi:ATP-binding cassette subfamily B protein
MATTGMGRRWLAWRRWVAWLADSPRWTVMADAARIGPRLTAALAGLTLATALLPTAAALAMGALLGALPGTVAHGLGSAAGRQAVASMAALGAVFVLQQLAGPLQSNAGEALGRRYMGWMHRRVMRAALRPATIRHLEDPQLHDKVRQSLGGGNLGARITGIAGAPRGLAIWAGERLRGAAALLVVAHFSPWLALLLAAAWLHHQRRLRAVHNELIAARLLRTPGMRHADYLGGLPLAGGVAKEVRVFGLGRWLGERFQRAWLGQMEDLWAKRRGLPSRMALATLPVLAADVLAVGLIGRAAVLGEIGLGALVVYVNGVLQSQAFGSVSDSDQTVQYGTAGLKTLAELEGAVAHDPRLALPGSRPAPQRLREGIRFENVWFGYPGRPQPVFRGLTLEIPAGHSLAIVGANGAGKTTLIKLLARLYDPHAGRITVDGVDLRELDARSWQRRVAAIFQDYVRYQLPAYDNIALGAPERQAERPLVAEAARRAGALQLVEGLPRGWETVLSREYTGGADLSGGQWQRIALARALFAAGAGAPAGRCAPSTGEGVHAGAPILVLDEPTAHLDVRAEAAFYESFLRLTTGVTTIIISHRFSTVRRAERIVVLHQGAVAEAGSHEALIARGGRYAELFGLQAQRFRDGARERE